MPTPATQKSHIPSQSPSWSTASNESAQDHVRRRGLEPAAVDALLADESLEFVPSKDADEGDQAAPSTDHLLSQLSLQLKQLQAQQRQIDRLLKQAGQRPPRA